MNKKNLSLKEIFVEAYKSYKKKDLKTAENHCYKILSIDPYHFDSTFLLATISAMNNNFEKAKHLLLKAIEIDPKNVNALSNLGTAYTELGESKEAVNYFNKVLEIDPNHTNANYSLGVTYYRLKDFKKSKSYLQKTVRIQKNFAFAFFSLGNVHLELKEFENAVSCYQKAIELNPNIIGAYNNLGLVFRGLNDFENALSCYEKVLKLKPNSPNTLHNRALAFKELGDFTKAIKSHQDAIKYEPENFAHYFYLSDLKKEILDLNLRKKIESSIADNKTTKINNAFGYYLLSRYEKKLKNYEKELDFLIKGHQNYFEFKKEKFNIIIKYCFEDALQISENIKVEKLNQKNDYDLKPIFIIGVPRCGSTLVEKIIASGESSIPIGEETTILENFINKKILETQSLNLGNIDSVKKELFDIYKNKGLVSKKYDFIFTDKSLNNFFYLNLIKEIYPNAKIINCQRDILSSIMSIFQNNLSDLAWTHNLDNIFKYFDNYFKIVENFKKSNPDLIYELEFNKLVNYPEEESKNLMKFCNLSWSKKCLEFYKRKELISKTASNVQIRKPIYKHSVNKYLPYKNLLSKYGKKYSWYN